MIQITKWLSRGPRPRSLSELAGKTDVVINLETGSYEDISNEPYESEFPAEFYIERYNYPFSNFLPPSLTKLRFVADLIHHNIVRGKRVYVHCKWGKDRTGMAIAAYRIIYGGWSSDQAILEAKSFGFRKFVYWPWLIQLKRLDK